MKINTFVKFSSFLVAAFVFSSSYASDSFSRPSERFDNRPDFLRDNRDSDNDNGNSLEPFKGGSPQTAAPSSPPTQPPAPPPIPQRRVQK